MNLAFFSGNEVFWKTRWENSIDGIQPSRIARWSATRRRTPTRRSTRTRVWTGTWRDPRFSPPADGGRPENALTGTIFTVNCWTTILWHSHEAVPAADAGRSASGATRPSRPSSRSSATHVRKHRMLGYEWDEDLDNGFRPPG